MICLVTGIWRAEGLVAACPDLVYHPVVELGVEGFHVLVPGLVATYRVAGRVLNGHTARTTYVDTLTSVKWNQCIAVAEVVLGPALMP